MYAFVIKSRDKPKVFNSVVEFVTVDVMQLHAWRNWAVMRFPDKDVFKFLLSVFHYDAPVTVWSNISAHLMFSSRGFMGIGDAPVRSRIAGLPVKRWNLSEMTSQ